MASRRISRHPDSHGDSNGYANGYANRRSPDSNCHGHKHADEHANSNAHRYSNAHGDRYSNADSDRYGNAHGDRYSNADSDQHANFHTSRDAHGDTHSRRTRTMPYRYYPLIVLMLLAVPASAGTYEATFAAGDPDDTFQAQCADLHDKLGNPPDWTLNKCLRRFAKMGMRTFNRRQIAESETIKQRQNIKAAEDAFDQVFPE